MEDRRNKINISHVVGDYKSEDLDVLTGILSRKSFFETAQKLVDEHPEGYYVFSFVNIDNFKIINDRFGMEVGDAVLKHVALIAGAFSNKSGGICGRLSADNFALLFPKTCIDSDEIYKAHGAINKPEAISQPLRIRIGRYFVDSKVDSVITMFDKARIAANSIRNTYDKDTAVFDVSMLNDILRRQVITDDMEKALEQKQFKVLFQPQYNHATGAIIGAEALVRWQKDKEVVSPAEFIPVFEENGFIYELDKYVWEQACALWRKWKDEGIEPVPLSVNVSRKDILHEDFMDVLSGIMAKYDVPVDKLRLEITESAFSESSGTIIAKTNQLYKLGFLVEIDDFGSGYSSLNLLKDVQASVIKLDMKFFQGSKNDQRAGNIVESVVRMARWLGMAVIAEGVENLEDADFLKTIGCHYVQGYLYAKPMDADSFKKLIVDSTKEHTMSRLETLKTLDNNEFWNPKSMETLIFNSYVGGACIFEYHNGATEVLRTNDEYVKQFGKVLDGETNVKNLTFSDYLCKEDKARFFRDIDECIRLRNQKASEYKIVRGEYVEFVRITVRVIARASERYLLYGAIANMTEQRLAEIEEHNASLTFSSIVGSIDGGVLIAKIKSPFDVEIMFTNDGFYSMLSYTKEQFQAEVKSISDIFYSNDRAAMWNKIVDDYKGKEDKSGECRCVKRDGSIIWTYWSNVVINLEGVKEKVVMCIVQDITEEIEADKQLNVLNEAAHEILACPDCNQAINHILEKTLSYFDGDRTYIVEIFDNDTLNNTYEVCALDVKSCMDILKNIPTSVADEWLSALSYGNFVVVNNLSEVKNDKLRELLRLKNISSITLAPLCRESKTIGFVAVDNPKKDTKMFKNIVALGDYVAVLLNRRDLSDGIVKEQQSMTTLLDDLPEGFMRLELTDDHKLMPIYLNTATKRMVGMDDEMFNKVYGDNAINGMHPDDVPLAYEACQKAMVDGEGIGRVYRLRSGDGGYVAVSLKCKVTFGADGKKYLNVYYSGTNIPIERKKIEIELLDSLPCGVGLFAYNGIDVDTWFLNKGYEKLTGRSETGIEKDYVHTDFIHPDDKTKVMDALRKAAINGENPTYEFRIKCGNGEYKKIKSALKIKPHSENNWLILAVYTPV